MARAIPTRLRMPPRQLGRDSVSSVPARSTTARLSATRSAIVGAHAPLHQAQGDVLGHRHRVEQRRELEHVADVAPQRRPARRASRSGTHARRPSRRPASGSAGPTMSLSATLFPRPEDPMMTVFWPSGTSSETPREDFVGPSNGSWRPVARTRITAAPAPRTRPAPGSPRSRARRRAWSLRRPPRRPPRVESPRRHPIRATAKPKLALLTRPNQMSLNR